jgi:hypothetical protein
MDVIEVGIATVWTRKCGFSFPVFPPPAPTPLFPLSLSSFPRATCLCLLLLCGSPITKPPKGEYLLDVSYAPQLTR